MGKGLEGAPFGVEELRTVLGSNLGRFRRASIKERFTSHHADFYVVRLKGRKKQKEAVPLILAKQFVTPHPKEGEVPEELYYLQEKDPVRQCTLELENSKNIARYFGRERLIPSIRGYLSEGETRILFRDYLNGPTHGELLRNIATLLHSSKTQVADLDRLHRNKHSLLLVGVKNGARFEGLCNARPDLVSSYTATPATRETRERLANQLFATHLTRLYYSEHLDCLGSEKYDHTKVCAHLKTSQGLDLEDTVTRLMALKKSGLVCHQILGHGDYNVDHVYYKNAPTPQDLMNLSPKSMVIDLEKFGLHSPTRGLTTLFMGGVDDTSVPEDSRDLLYFIDAHLAYVHAFAAEAEDPHLKLVAKTDAQMNKISGEEVHDFLCQSGAINNRREYVEFLLSFFADAIEEGTHLHATYRRYSQEHLQRLVDGLEGYTVSELRASKAAYTTQLFERVAEVEGSLTCLPDGNRDLVRGYFLGLGQLLNDLGILHLTTSTLDRIRGGSFSGDLLKRLLAAQSPSEH